MLWVDENITIKWKIKLIEYFSQFPKFFSNPFHISLRHKQWRQKAYFWPKIQMSELKQNLLFLDFEQKLKSLSFLKYWLKIWWINPFISSKNLKNWSEHKNIAKFLFSMIYIYIFFLFFLTFSLKNFSSIFYLTIIIKGKQKERGNSF